MLQIRRGDGLLAVLVVSTISRRKSSIAMAPGARSCQILW
jgi:hypothetical protein